jgi:hypothetical protein
MRRGRIDWYDIVFLGIAAMMVYPDRILDWLGELTGRTFGGWYLMLIEGIAITLMVGTMLLLMPLYPKLQWWHPLASVGLLAGVRVATWLVVRMFGLDD